MMFMSKQESEMENKTNAIFQGILDEAVQAGREAGEKFKPTPVGFYRADIMGNRIGPTDIIEDGVCGFAWVKIKGNTAFGKWAAKHGKVRDDYPSGKSFWISNYNQSMEKKEAHAQAMAAVLNKHGIEAYAMSRMD